MQMDGCPWLYLLIAEVQVLRFRPFHEQAACCLRLDDLSKFYRLGHHLRPPRADSDSIVPLRAED
jgi:hypothetical protein